MNNLSDNEFYGQENNPYIRENMEMIQPKPESGKKDRKKGKHGFKIFLLVMNCALISGAMGIGGGFIGNYLFSAQTEKGKQIIQQDKDKETELSAILKGLREKSMLEVKYVDTNELLTPAEVYASNVNSTVGITTVVTTNYWGFTSSSPASGSGFILTSDGYILTNFHVIEDSDSITVTMYDGTSYEAELVGYDESNDIAVLKVDAEKLTPVVIGDSDNLNVGDSVVAIGNPLGELTFSLTSGAISALDREVTLSSNMKMDLIQTDCAINSGNSGGALFNLYGEVVGITNAKYSGSGSGASIDNIGFAIPVNQVMGVVQSIIEKGYIVKPYIGISVRDVSTEAQKLGLPKGAAVQDITQDSPAAESGLKANDIVTAVNGEEIDESSKLVEIVQNASAGDVLRFSVYRQGKEIEIQVKVGEQVQSAHAKEAENEKGMDMQQIPGQGQQGFPRGGGFER